MAHQINDIPKTVKPWHGLERPVIVLPAFSDSSRHFEFVFEFVPTQIIRENTFGNAERSNFIEIRDDILALK